jgi:hypothetical protein
VTQMILFRSGDGRYAKSVVVWIPTTRRKIIQMNAS